MLADAVMFRKATLNQRVWSSSLQRPTKKPFKCKQKPDAGGFSSSKLGSSCVQYACTAAAQLAQLPAPTVGATLNGQH